jgi:hypothetical protein
VFFGDVFRLSVLLAPNAVTGFAGGVLETASTTYWPLNFEQQRAAALCSR